MSKLLAIITGYADAIFQRTVIAGVRQIASPKQYEITIAPDLAPVGGADGFIVIANALSDAALRALKATGRPVTLVAHRFEGLPSVLASNQLGIAALVRHLVEGCRRRKLVYIGGLRDQLDGQEREVTFRHELMRYGLSLAPGNFLTGDFSPEIARNSVQELIDSGREFDAILSADYMMACAALDVLREAGRVVPRDVSVVGYGDDHEAEEAGLTVASANVMEVGRSAGRQLISQMNGLHISGETTLAAKLIVRQTCGGYKESR